MVNYTSEILFTLDTQEQVHVRAGGPGVSMQLALVCMFYHTKTAQGTNSLLAGLNSKIVYLSMLSLLALCVTVSFLSQ